MKITWVADNFYPSVQRGAELEDYYLICEAQRRGHEVERVGNIKTASKDMDLIVLANFVDTFNIGELTAYLSKAHYVHIEHDLRAPQFPYYKYIANDAIFNVYHSPYQEEYIKKFAGEFKHIMHPMCLPEDFKNMGLQRFSESEVLFVGDYSWEKGYKEMAEWLDLQFEKTIWHYGGGFPNVHPKMKEMGWNSAEQMPRVYNTFSSMIFLPKYPQACSRTMAEAYLCGITNIIGNGKDGFSSWEFDKERYDVVRDILVNSKRRFWDIVEKL